jgi:hypothetical protein
MKCPGQDTRYWDAGAIYDVECPACGVQVEFFKDESRGRCPACGFRFRNPEIDLGCAQWCPHAEQCVGTLERSGDGPGESVIDGLVSLVKALPSVDEARQQRGLRALVQAQSLLLEQPATPRVVLAGALLRGLGADAPPPGALSEAGLDRVSIAQVQEVLEEGSAPEPSAEARLVQDAVSLSHFAETLRAEPDASAQPDEFLTSTALKLARDLKRRQQRRAR